jgi:CHAT domain-containing protein/tetratricopeptide (TPR) repeat protein
VIERIQGTPPPKAHPDLETIAAHADRRLAADQRTAMVEHLAGCSECYEVYAETLKFASDESAEAVVPGRTGERIVPLPAFTRRPAFRIAAGLAAAVLLLALPLWTSRGRLMRPASLVAELAEAVGERRLVEPRVTGGFRYARLVVMRSGEAALGLDAQPPTVLTAVAKIRDRAEKDPSPQALGALGVTYLVSGDTGAAVKALESATAQTTDDARLWSDLAAAYLARARQEDEPADIPRGLEAAERAVALPDPPTEAWFNRALALEALHLDDAAKKAWQDYLDRDSSSGWAGEARQHLEALNQIHHSSAEEDKARVRAALAEGPEAVDRVADESPQALRTYFDEELLPAWADATLVGHPNSASHRESIQILGDALVRVTGDAIFRDTGLALAKRRTVSSARDALRAQAQGFVALRQARMLYAVQQTSCPQARAAARELENGGSPYVGWARLQEVIACLYPSRPKEAIAELTTLESVADPRRYIQLLGRVRWMHGLFRGGRGELDVALDLYRSALDAFRTTRDASNESNVHVLLAENLGFFGETREAWRERLSALALLGEVRDPIRRYAMLGEGADACLVEGLLGCTLHLGNAAVDTALGSSRATAVAEALVRRAGVLHRLGAEDRASADLAESRRWAAQIESRDFAEVVEAEANRTEGEMLASQRPDVAIRSLSEALTFYRANAPVLVPPLYLLRARAESALGSYDAAAADLQAGIEARETERASLGDAGLRVSFFDTAFPLFDDMVHLQVNHRHDPERGLEFVERGQARSLVDSLSGGAHSPLDIDEIRRELPVRVALVYYVPLEKQLYIWVVTREGSRFFERPLPAMELGRRIAAHRAALEMRAPVSVVNEDAALLHDDLVRPLLQSLGEQDALVIVPSGVLQSFPFASLWDRRTRRYLVEDYAVSLAPSGTIFVLASREANVRAASPTQALVVGNPRIDRKRWPDLASLQGAEAEATEIAALYPRADLLMGSNATKTAFLDGFARGQVVHFAGHAAASRDLPSAGRLFFAPDPERNDSGALYLRDLEGQRFTRTRAVVLAACRTAAGEVSRVEGPLSLGRPFLAAGVPFVVASLWDIDDSLSQRFFVALHRGLVGGSDPVRALRAAQIAFIHDSDPSSSHPATWAALVSMGGLDLHSSLIGVMS